MAAPLPLGTLAAWPPWAQGLAAKGQEQTAKPATTSLPLPAVRRSSAGVGEADSSAAFAHPSRTWAGDSFVLNVTV